MEVPFSKNFISVNLGSVNQFFSNHLFLVTLDDGEHYEAKIIHFDKEEVQLLIQNPTKRIIKKTDLNDGDTLNITRNNVVIFNDINQSFVSRLNGEVSMGFNLARSNRLRQYSLRSNATYNSNTWLLFANLNLIRSTQESSNIIRRYEGGLTGLIYLPKEWFVLGWVNLLKNSQQLVQLRVDTKVGLGKFLILKPKTTWTAQMGLNLNNEKFMNDLEGKSSEEYVFGTSFSLNNVSGFDVISSLIYYYGLKDTNRSRSDVRLDVKYDIFKDFFVKIGTSMNYDSQPTVGATKFDYVIQSTLGWKF